MRKRSEAGRPGRSRHRPVSTASSATTDRQRKPPVEIPHDSFNEQVLIAAALTDANLCAKLTATIKPDLFVATGHASAWAALCECQRRGIEPTPDTLRQLGGDEVKPDYLKALLRDHPESPPAISHHVSMLGWDAARARAVEGPITELLRALEDPRAEPEKVKALARRIPTAFDGFGGGGYVYEPGGLVREMMADIRARRQGQAVYPFGIEGLDQDEEGRWRLVPGLKPGQVTLVSAVTGGGKSVFAVLVALAQANMKRRVLYGAWEMKAPITLELIAIASLGYSRYEVSTGQITDEQEEALKEEGKRLSAWIRFWRLPYGSQPGESSQRDNDAALDKIHGAIADSGCNLAVLDLFKRALRHTRPDDEEQALYRIHDIAEETDAHLLLCHQQRFKDVEMRKDKRPTREGAKGSGAWVEMPDTMIGIHNPAVFKRVDHSVLEADILKQRYAKWPLAVEFDWDPDRMQLSNGRSVPYDPSEAPRRRGAKKTQTDDEAEAFDTWAKGEGGDE